MQGDRWRYFKGTREPPANWTAVNFNDASWPEGPSGFGYGDGDDATDLADMRYDYVSLYIRRAFSVESPSALRQLTFSIDYDDGFVAYLNGIEVARSNVSGTPPSFNTPADSDHEASRGDASPQPVNEYDLSAFIPYLVVGKNVLAVQGHTVKASSMDFSLIPSLTGSLSSPPSPASSELFRVVVLSDTDNYARLYPQIFSAQTRWIAENAARLNIKFVIHAGDIVQNWDSITEWKRADASMTILDEAGIPYSVVPGNHDHANMDTDGSSAYYNTYFGTARFSSQPWWGGSYRDNDNNYQLLSIGGVDYLFISLDFCPSTDELEWAHAVLAQHSGRKAVLTTHAYLNDYGATSNITVCGDTGYLWDGLIKQHANLQIVFSGHMHTQDGEAYRANRSQAGQLVHQMLADYQAYPTGGDGWLRILEFDGPQGQVHVRTYSPYLDQSDTDPSGHFSFNYP